MSSQIHIGDRVYVPPRLATDPYSLATHDTPTAVRIPGIHGRVVAITDGVRGQVAEIQDRNFARRAAPLDLCRRQRGRTATERAAEGARRRGLRGAR